MSIANPPYSRTVSVSVPATSANLGPGFDCLGLALDLRNEVTAVATGPDIDYDDPQQTRYEIQVAGTDAAKIPTGRENLLVEAAETLFRQAGRRPTAVSIHMVNHIPVGSGLGSSSSAIVAGLVVANAVILGGYTSAELIRLAVEMEGHPDNVAPAMMGGLVLGVLPDGEHGPVQLLLRRWTPPQLTAIIVLPDFPLLTSEARAALPPSLTRADGIFNASRLGLLLHALTSGEYDCLRVAMADRIHQPYRLTLIPGARAAYDAAYEAGALGVALSGAGPSLLALAAGHPEDIAAAMSEAFARAGLTSRAWILQPTPEGVRVTSG